MTPGMTIRASDIPAGLGLAPIDATAPGEAPSAGAVSTLQGYKDAAERAFIVAKLRENDWNMAATAKAIETPRSNLYKKLEVYGITREVDG
jgi:two-component system nitrogen regulation response regulator NtrX